jgi:uncharacterized protein YneR
LFKEKDKEENTEENKINEFVLKNNSCFVMKKGFQTKYKHSVPKQLKVKKPRLNLTFRQIKKK